jgi:serine phosphatase RsbU (regulator of sigma subunit)
MAEHQENAEIPEQLPPSEEPSANVEWADWQGVAGRPLYDSFLRDAHNLVKRLRQRDEEFYKLARLTDRVNRGNTLDEVLDNLYEEAKSIIPYDRIGFSLVDRQREVAVARWARSERELLLAGGYEAPLAGSTLQQIIDTGKPRIINDLEAYLREKPASKNTELILREGIRSSLTCPLIVQGVPVGFLFFSSVHKNTYSKVHVGFFQQIASQLATIVEKGRLYSELAEQKAVIERQNRAMAYDLEMARQIQQSLIPQPLQGLRGIEIAFVYEPAAQVGGDILDVVPLEDGHVLFFVGDAMGHGVRAAMVMSIVKTALHASLQFDPHPAAVLAHINRTLARFLSDHFVTAACCLLDPSTRRGRFAMAGHAGPLWFRAATGDVVQQDSPSLPLGIADGTQYAATAIELEAGDALVFSTDGIVEAFDPQGVQYGAERFQASVHRHGRQNAQELCAGIQRDQARHCRDCVREDDLTLLVVKAVATG